MPAPPPLPPSLSPYNPEFLTAHSALRAASTLSLHVLSARAAAPISKSDLSPVTIADFAIQALLSATFSTHFPTDSLVGEEDAAALRSDDTLLSHVVAELVALRDVTPASELVVIPTNPEEICRVLDICGSGSPAGGARTWVFDPIDGTQAFIHSHLYAINIGLVASGRQILGAVACPLLPIDAAGPITNASTGTTGTLFSAAVGCGSYVEPLTPTGESARRLTKRSEFETPVALVGCSSLPASAHNPLHESVAAKLSAEFPGSDLISWVVRYCALALGLGNASVWVYLKPERRSKIWDHAGAQLVFVEAGGKVTDTRGVDMDFQAGRLVSENYGILAADEGVYDKVKRVLQETMREFGRKEIE